MAFTLKELPYSKNALSPYISEETMDFHHGKHLQTYVNNTNNLIAGTDFEGLSIEEIIVNAKQGPLFNNAAQVWNHNFFFECMTPNSNGKPSGELQTAIDCAFGSFDAFKDKFAKTAAGQFGSGWAWLVKKSDGNLDVVSYSNALTPLLEDDKKPLLVIDVWEHAYYVDYRNARPKFIDAFFEVINWDFVAKNL